MRISENFSLGEFLRSETAKRLGIPNEPPAYAVRHLERLVEFVLQPVRNHFGPIRITSGYRSQRLNAAVGGGVHSDHMRGMAADCYALSGVDGSELIEWLKAEGIPFDQAIYYQGPRIHVSCRPSDNRREVLTSMGGGEYREGLVGAPQR